MSKVHTFLADTASRVLPRILTQVCRDPLSPFHGACDRNWWHYKIRDFPSIILQQAGYALALADGSSWLDQSTACHPADDTATETDAASGESPSNSALASLAAASARFWNQRALRHGAFEEYYPYEQGYPPAAFSTLAVAKLAHMGIVPVDQIRPGLAIAARQLTRRFEAKAANQQIAGTAALAVIRSLDESLVAEPVFRSILERTLALQHAEGWFPEYDGPDLGYLAVSIDCLYDILDHSADPRVLPAIRKAADFISWFALTPLRGAGMHNSRNTDYLTPYGLVRLATEEQKPHIVDTVQALFTRNHPRDFHFFDAVDDRYWCHYTGPSLFRSLKFLENHALPTGNRDVQPPALTSHSGSGHALLHSTGNATALVSSRKGGIVTAHWPDGREAADFGWTVQTASRLLVSHWWSHDWEIGITAESATCKGWLVAHKEHTSTPWKHSLLRLASLLTGRRLISVLKRLVIFKKATVSHQFTRTVSWDGESLLITDLISGLAASDTITRSPRASKRHVASADSFHPQDIHQPVDLESIERDASTFKCVTRYGPPTGQ